MYTADQAREEHVSDLDEKIRDAVREARGNSATIRIYVEDPYRHSIEEELERRGFKNIEVPDFVLKGDVYFEW